MSKTVKFNETLKTAKTIYVVSGLKEMITYLDAKEELGDITEEDSDKIIDLATAVYANMTVGELDKIRNMF